MTNEMILTIVISMVIGVVLTMFIIFAILKKKGIKTEELLKMTVKGLSGINNVTDALKSMFPQNIAIGLVDKIIDYAEIAVNRAEQLYHINEIAGGDRKQEAVNFTYQSLGLAGIEVTPEIRAIVDGCVEAAVLSIGHYVELNTAELGETE